MKIIILKNFLTLFCLVAFLNVSRAQTKSVKQGAVNSKFQPITKIDPDESLHPQPPVHPIDPGDPHPVVPGPVDTAHFDPGPFDMIPQAELSKSSNSNTVGSPISSFNVSNLGAATYNIEIETPAGGGLVPHIGLAYNSQNGYGLAGFGFSITGISVITRTGKDLSHDGIQKGLNLAAGDNYCLDGKRLVLVSGIAGSNGSIYSPLGNPRIKVTLHGNDQPSSNLWFEVSDENGIISYYGQSDNSRVIVASGSQQCAMAWYINSSEDIHTNVINFAYVSSNYCLRPSCISYGINRKKNRGISCTISFLYESLGSLAKPFMLGPVTGMIDTKLVGITTSVNSQIYRNYSFTYNTSSDNSWSKFARLIKVNVKNKSGQSMSPITIDWNYLPSARVSDQTTNLQTSNSTYLFEETSKNFLACDLNNDGVSDIVKISQVDDYLYRYSDKNNSKNAETWLYVSLSSKKNSSNTYQSPIAIMLPAQMSFDDFQRYITCQSAIDVDGDGYNDLVLPYFNPGMDANEAACFVIYGKELVDGSAQCHFIKSFAIPKDCTNPLITTGTFSGNGKNEILVISDVPDGNNAYGADMLRHTFGNNYDGSLFKLTLPEKPKKIFSGDFNSDGLVDIIFLSESKYTIFYNQGGDESSIKFSDSNSYTGTSFNDKWRFAQGDFDGDGRLDFVYPEGRDLNFALNQGNGNFTIINKVATLDLGDGNSSKDDDKYTLLAFDQDGDGRADVFASNAYYAYHGFPKFKYSFSRGCATWLYSTGTSLVPYKQVEIDRDDDLLQSKIFLGDFDGNGILEVANYGGSLAGTVVSDYENIRIYPTNSCNMAESGKVSRITDSFGKSTNISYLPGTDPSVYQNTVAPQYPVIDCTLPLPLVSRVSVDGGAASTQVTNYAYSGLKVQLRGDGILGFAKMTNNNITLGLKNEMVITKWDNKRYIPTEIKQTSSIDNDVTNSVSTITVEERTDNNYFAYNSKKEEYDWDGNPTITTTNYDVERCLLNDQTISYDKGDTYQTTSYSDYVLKGGVWLPTYVTKTQKHTDDNQTFSIKTAYTYDDNGETLSLTERSNTNMPLSKEFTYDAFGNVLSTVEYGNSVSANIKYTDYDTSGRFVVKASESGSQNYSTYAYDVFGNMISESDCSNPSSILTTNYTYDDWGNKLTAVNP